MITKALLATTLALMAGGAPAEERGRASTGDDDLRVVKRAVEPSAVGTSTDETPAPRKAGAPAQWLRVRVVEKRVGGHEKRVSINLPLALVRALGDVPIDVGCHGRAAGDRPCPRLRLADVLAALDKGQSLVEVDDEDGTRVRVWIE